MHFEVYKDRRDEFRWRLKHSNGNILATSSEGYKAKASALKCIENIQNSRDAEIRHAGAVTRQGARAANSPFARPAGSSGRKNLLVERFATLTVVGNGAAPRLNQVKHALRGSQ